MKVDNSKYLNFTQQPDFEQILTNPILDIAARFWETDRYRAFRTCYRSMRVIDDLVDERKADEKKLTDDERNELAAVIRSWLADFESGKSSEPFLTELMGTARKFHIPLWPWQRLARAMVYDLNHEGFADFATFLRYSEGAAVAPASIFMHLCGVTRQGENFIPPEFDIRRTARPLARFSYLVHIIRDFQKDQQAGLNYFADNLLTEYQLDRVKLKETALGGQIPPNFRKLVKRYFDFAGYYRTRARISVDRTKLALLPQYQLSLEIIYQLYSQIFEKIDFLGGCFTSEELNPTPREVQDRIYQTVTTFKPVK